MLPCKAPLSLLLQAVRTCRELGVWSEELLQRSLTVFLQAFQQLACAPEAEIRRMCAAGFSRILKSIPGDRDK